MKMRIASPELHYQRASVPDSQAAAVGDELRQDSDNNTPNLLGTYRAHLLYINTQKPILIP